MGEVGDGGGEPRSLERTPTWAVAVVCLALLAISLLIERLLHLLANFLIKKRRKSLIKALDKVKSELILLGFISLFLSVVEKPISRICIPESLGRSFLPCSNSAFPSEVEEEARCSHKKVSLLSSAAAVDLQYLIFALAFFHSVSCMLTFGLGMAKLSTWKSWEAETRTFEYQFTYDPERFRLVHQTSFGRRHLRYWSQYRFLRWPVNFLQHCRGSVYKVDYFTLRHGFILAHFTKGSNYDFQKFITRTLENDFGVVVGIRFWNWIFSILYMFFHAHVFHHNLWLPFIPLVLLLIVGTKLQGIITEMCLDSHRESVVVRGTFLVKPSNHFFWLRQPKLLLHLMHFILFQNSFQLAFFAWTWYKFGLRSCFHQETEDIIIKLSVGVLVQVLCGYVTLPLYALVTQMGTSMNKAVFTEGVVEGLKRWRTKAVKNIAKRNSINPSRPSLDILLRNCTDVSPSFRLDASYEVVTRGEVPVQDDSGTLAVSSEIQAAEVLSMVSSQVKYHPDLHNYCK
uniref:MLO-like protein n=1 Tax=Kalanchoe fedtschenkoi TaxID=63787 RepID=A0A7N0UHF2_KALFE